MASLLFSILSYSASVRLAFFRRRSSSFCSPLSFSSPSFSALLAVMSERAPPSLSEPMRRGRVDLLQFPVFFAQRGDLQQGEHEVGEEGRRQRRRAGYTPPSAGACAGARQTSAAGRTKPPAQPRPIKQAHFKADIAAEVEMPVRIIPPLFVKELFQHEARDQFQRRADQRRREKHRPRIVPQRG